MKDSQFIVTAYNLIDSEDYRKIMTSSKGIEMTYQWLRRNIVRAPMRNPRALEVHEKYFLKGYLAVSINERQLSESLFISRSTLKKNLNILVDSKILKVGESDVISRGGNQQAQKVYILGKWSTDIDLKGNEKYKEFLLAFDLVETPLFDTKE